jgi:plastocyanin
MLRRSVFTLLMLALVTSVLVSPGTSDARTPDGKLVIQAGAAHPTNRDAPYEYTRFYPEVLNVQRGQTVSWKILGFHSITFSKSGRPPFYRTDEVPGTYAIPESWAFGTGCGHPGSKACVLQAGTKFLSSGVPMFDAGPFSVKMDVAPGAYGYFCTVHPGMKGTINVVRKGVRVPAQRQVDAQVASQVRVDSANADALFRADQKPVSTVDADGRRVWRGLLGDSTRDNHVSILAFVPSNLEIAAGDRVRYTYRDHTVNEVHTVTFPTEATGGFEPVPHGLGAFGIYFSCDPDSPTSGMPGLAGPWAPIGPPCPANLELVHAPWMVRAHHAPGDQVLTPASYHDSGLLVPKRASSGFRKLPDTSATFPSAFDAEFPAAGTFKFECNIHVDLMTGSVSVT